MADGFQVTVVAQPILALFDRLGATAEYVCREVARDLAKRIVTEAQRRVQRATGTTESGISFDLTYDGKGYIVRAYTPKHQPYPVDIYLEYGTQKMLARPFFWAAVELEGAGYMDRLSDALQRWLDEVGR